MSRESVGAREIDAAVGTLSRQVAQMALCDMLSEVRREHGLVAMSSPQAVPPTAVGRRRDVVVLSEVSSNARGGRVVEGNVAATTPFAPHGVGRGRLTLERGRAAQVAGRRQSSAEETQLAGIVPDVAVLGRI